MPSGQERDAWTRDLRGFSEAEMLGEDEEFQVLIRARRRAGRARLIAGLICLVVVASLVASYGWYQTAPVSPGFYPGRVLGGIYPTGVGGEFRYPLMWVRSSPFWSEQPELKSVSLLDEEGNVIARSDCPEFVPADGQGSWNRFEWGWVTLQVCPGTEERIAYKTRLETASGVRSYGIGALAVLGVPEGSAQETLIDVIAYVGSTQGFSSPNAPGLWLVLSVRSFQSEPVEIRAIAPAGLGWLFTPGPTVLRGPEEGIYPAGGDTRVIIYPLTGSNPYTDPASGAGHITIVRESPLLRGTVVQLPETSIITEGIFFAAPGEWFGLDGPATLGSRGQARFAVGLAPYTEQLRKDYFLYLSAEIALAREGYLRSRGVTLLDEQPRSWRAFQTVPAGTD